MQGLHTFLFSFSPTSNHASLKEPSRIAIASVTFPIQEEYHIWASEAGASVLVLMILLPMLAVLVVVVGGCGCRIVVAVVVVPLLVVSFSMLVLLRPMLLLREKCFSCHCFFF